MPRIESPIRGGSILTFRVPPYDSELAPASGSDSNLGPGPLDADYGQPGHAVEGDTEEPDIVDPELTGMTTDKWLVETEIMLTARLAGRGFTLSSRWRTHGYKGSGRGAVETRAEFSRK